MNPYRKNDTATEVARLKLTVRTLEKELEAAHDRLHSRKRERRALWWYEWWPILALGGIVLVILSTLVTGCVISIQRDNRRSASAKKICRALYPDTVTAHLFEAEGGVYAMRCVTRTASHWGPHMTGDELASGILPLPLPPPPLLP